MILGVEIVHINEDEGKLALFSTKDNVLLTSPLLLLTTTTSTFLLVFPPPPKHLLNTEWICIDVNAPYLFRYIVLLL